MCRKASLRMGRGARSGSVLQGDPALIADVQAELFALPKIGLLFAGCFQFKGM